MKFQSTQFIKTVVKPDQFPASSLPEIAVVGRSNVGKSTLLNHLFRKKGLVKTSSTPGKTQALNIFSVDDRYLFVDLPGYGFAKVPEKERAKWGKMIEGYLADRSSLKVILFLLDIRRTLGKEDKQMLEWIAYHDIPAIVVLTKVDKVKRNEREKQTRLLRDSVNPFPCVHYSAVKNEGRDLLIRKISEALNA